jgi:hypothetical protein
MLKHHSRCYGKYTAWALGKSAGLAHGPAAPVAVLRRDLCLGAGERIDVDAAIGAPVTAMEGYCDRSFAQQILEANQAAPLVG